MENSQIIKKIEDFQKRLKMEIKENRYDSPNLQFLLWKTFIMSEISLRTFYLNLPIENFEKNYFNKQTAVSREFYDWDLGWIADGYCEIDDYMKKYYQSC